MKTAALLSLLALVAAPTAPVLAKSVPAESHWQVVNAASGDLNLWTLQLKSGAFRLYSQPGALKPFAREAAANKDHLANKTIHGSLIYIAGQTRTSGDSLVLEGHYQSVYSQRQFRATIHRGAFRGRIFAAGKASTALQGRRLSQKQPLRNYAAVIDSAIQTTERKFYNPHLLQQAPWLAFKQQLRRQGRTILDDYQLKTVFTLGAARLPFSHFDLSSRRTAAAPATRSNTSTATTAVPAGNVALRALSPQTAYLQVRSFDGTHTEMDSIVNLLKARPYQHLIIDLRRNQGGSIEAVMPLARYLSPDTVYLGAIVTRRWFEHSPLPPTPAEYRSLQPFSQASYAGIQEAMHRAPGLSLIAPPDPQAFKGKVYLLVDQNTASACEPLVYSYQHNKRAVVVGENTAGAMLSGDRFDLPVPFVLRVPTADYYTADGKRLDLVGVAPDVKVAPEASLDYVLHTLINQ
ncbi:S41 family peptidase [Hymenobacter sp. B81]|uniref:S41 family peptidase n=1 Tax=Hymenobacter sp. B81 TaxID=3344878 RepID=UPI0037DDCA44